MIKFPIRQLATALTVLGIAFGVTSRATAVEAVVVKRNMIQTDTKFLKVPFSLREITKCLGQPSRGKGHFLYWDAFGMSYYDDQKKEDPTRILSIYLQEMPKGENPDHPTSPYRGSLLVSTVNLKHKIDVEKMRKNGYGRNSKGMLPIYYYRGLGFRVNVITAGGKAITVTIEEE